MSKIFVAESEERKADSAYFSSLSEMKMLTSINKTSSSELEARTNTLTALNTSVLANEGTSSLIGNVYNAWINEAFARNAMFGHSINGNSELYGHFATFIHGTYDPRILSEIFFKIEEYVSEGLEKQGRTHETAAFLSNNLLLRVFHQAGFIERPQYQVIKSATKALAPYKSALNNLSLPDQESYSSDQVLQAFIEFANNLGADASDLTIRKKDVKRTVFTPKTMILSIPQKDTQKSKVELQLSIAELVGHDFLTAWNGKRSGFSLLQYGLDGYLKWQEGTGKFMRIILGSMLQGEIPSEEDFAIPLDLRYLAGALRMGADKKERNFKETEEIIRRVALLKDLLKGKPYKAAFKDSEKKAKDEVKRASVGVPNEVRGVSNAEIFRYTGGLALVIEWLNRHPNDFNDILLRWKVNPSNALHRAVLKQYT
jgi:hypothetical protein